MESLVLPSKYSFSTDGVHVFGAREHNLKNVDVFIPRNKITVVTGLSGSGKSSLAFDTIYAEGQRRYLESLSVYARYFIDQMKRPEVDVIYGLSPSIAIHQKTTSFNPRSTVGTITEIYDYVRLLYSHLGEVFCPHHNLSLRGQKAEEIAADIMNLSCKHPISILSPVARGKKGEFAKEFEKYLSEGLDRAFVDGKWMDLGKVHKLEKRKDHFIDLLLDKLPLEKKYEKRIQQAVQKSLNLSEGYVKVLDGKGFEQIFSLHFSCPKCDYSFFQLEPKFFSFNSPKGACTTCGGTGLSYYEEEPDEEESDSFDEVCSACQGRRLKQEVLQVKIKGKDISEISAFSSDELKKFLLSLKFKGTQEIIFNKILKTILFHLKFLKELGIGYLSLDRSLTTLSGGESQRLRLVSQLSSPLIGVLYVLDEPSIGLHSRDHALILNVLEKIRDRGNTVVIVEHDEESICHADKVIDLGPGAGKKGGYIVAQGTLDEIKKNKKSLTGAYLSNRESIPNVKSSWTGKEPVLEIKGARKNNLKNIDVKIPLGLLVGVSGVSGSGKSSLVMDTIYPLLQSHFLEEDVLTKELCDSIKGLQHLNRVIQINQKPIGRTPRSIPATYVQLFQMIRSLFSFLPDARVQGLSPGHFSFNVRGGRCENCRGVGSVKLEMRFLPNVWTQCDVCEGERYSPEVLAIKYREKSISDVLKMTVSEAEIFFKNHTYIHHRLKFLQNVGLDYITLGQSATTLSGGEAQRIKLSRELAKKTKGHTFYILDEPTTGLHFHDIKKLIELMRELSQKGNTVIVIEHNMDILKSCDYIFDLGPEGGEAGGYVMAQGRPSQISQKKASLTGQYLKKILRKN